VNTQTSDSSAMPTTKAGDVSVSSPLVGTQAAHGVVSGNDAPGASARADAHAGEALQSPVAGNADIDARVQAAATYANSLLHSARLVERMGQTELRVGIQTGEFGNVDIRTSMVRNQFTAQISVERGELGKVLAAELPSLQNRLSEHRLPMANITLQNQSSGGSEGFGQGSRQSQTMPQTATPQGSEGELAPVVMGLADASISSERLDVHM
jgi:flagellar hook-length control protein FliK